MTIKNCRRIHRACCIAFCMVALSTAMSPLAHAAAPWIIIVHGESLDEPVILADIRQNGRILGTPLQADSGEDLSTRPYFEVALFWGPEWLEFVESRQTSETLSPDQANQQGKFYPAVGTYEAIFVLMAHSPSAPPPPARHPSQEGLQILQSQGIPVRLDPDESTVASMLDDPMLWGIGVTLILLAGSVLVAYRRVPARRLRLDATPRGR